jgi:hypothetical protein
MQALYTLGVKSARGEKATPTKTHLGVIPRRERKIYQLGGAPKSNPQIAVDNCNWVFGLGI